MSRLRLQLAVVFGLVLSLVFAFGAPVAEAGKAARPSATRKQRQAKKRPKRARKAPARSQRGSKLARRVRTLRKQSPSKQPVSKQKTARRRPEVAFQQAVESARKRGGLIVDVGGEGAYAGAVNVNPGALTSTTGKPGRPIPNLVNGVAENIPIASQSASVVILENAPIRPGAAAELARVIKKGGTIKLSHPADYASQTHSKVVDATRGKAVSETRDGVTITVIAVP
jgi:hypothetical protein